MLIVLQSLFCLVFLLNSIEETESSFPFLVEPGPENVFAPINTTIVLNCTTISTAMGTQLDWLVYVINRTNPLTTRNSGFDLSRLGIVAEETSELSEGVISSLLTINASEVNNGTRVACQYIRPHATVVHSNQITITVFDLPSQPINVTVTDIAEHTVNVSWFLGIILGVDVEFNLTAVNLNTFKEVTFELSNQCLIFTPSAITNSGSCDVYRFQVTAINGAGRSEPSDAVETMLPSLPDISPINKSLDHVVEKKGGEISVAITSMIAGYCREYGVTNYRVVLRLQEEIMIFPIISTGEKLEITLGPLDGLMENTQYSYHITAENGVGNITSSSENFITSDLRGISAEINNSLNIQCLFINGSNALGCLILLVSFDDQIENISSTFYRSNSELILCGELNVIEDLSCYNEVFGFDVEADNSTSELGLPGELITTNTGICSPKNVSDDDESTGSTNVIIIVLSVSVLFTLVLVGAIAMVLGVYTRIIQHRKGSIDSEFENSTNQAYGVQDNEQTLQDSAITTEEHIYDNDENSTINQAYGVQDNEQTLQDSAITTEEHIYDNDIELQ